MDPETIRKLEELRHQRGDLFDKMSRINDLARSEGRDLRPHEQAKYDELEQRFDKLTDEVEAIPGNGNGDGISRRSAAGDRSHNGATRHVQGALIGREQRFADHVPDRRGTFTTDEAAEFSLGKAIRGSLTGDWEGSDIERRALAEGTNSAGGFLTPETLSSRIIDRVRAKARVLEAGAQTLLLDSDSVSLPRLATGVTPAWRAENAANAESDPAFERVTFTPRSLAVAVKVSYELWEDMIDGGAQLIENELLAALALKVDYASLRGSGTPPEPQGIRNQSGVTVTSLGTNGAAATYGDLLAALMTLYGANFTNIAAIMAPRTALGLASLADSTGQPLRPPKVVEDIPWYVTNQVPINLTQGTSSVASEIYLGDFSNLVIGIKPFLRIDFQRANQPPVGGSIKISSEKLIDTQQLYVLATLRADVQLLHPAAFNVLTGALEQA